MKVIIDRNVHRILPQALNILRLGGFLDTSRNGSVMVFPMPVSTVYERPDERVVFWSKRNFNIAFCLYEALWMLAGRDDVAPLKRYVNSFGEYSDDGERLHGAYGYRWRKRFGLDQIESIVNALRSNPKDRRCVLQMWNAVVDLGYPSKDIPCNDMATFQIDRDGLLNMVVFCRSNDILWGAYFANAFHFSFLLEYLARRIGVEIGTYTQVSVNWHGYMKTLQGAWPIIEEASRSFNDPYTSGEVYPPKLSGHLDSEIRELLKCTDQEMDFQDFFSEQGWARSAWIVLYAHQLYRNNGVEEAINFIKQFPKRTDWIVSMTQWLNHRSKK